MSHKPIIFPITIRYKGCAITTKALKLPYLPEGVIYKVVLISKLSATNQCWLNREKSSWGLIMGRDIGNELINAIREAILAYEELKPVRLRLPVKRQVKLLLA